jgi:hypothetical protein
VVLPSLVFSGNASNIGSGVVGNGSITLPSLVFTGSATDTTSEVTAAGLITLPSLIFSGSASDTTPGTELSGSITLPSLTFIGSATDSTSTLTITGDITLPSLVFSGASSVTLPDTTPPVITLQGSAVVNHIVNTPYVDAGATALDNKDGVITEDIVTVNNVNETIEGQYSVTYNVTDAAGNTATQVVRIVKVLDQFLVNVSDSKPLRSSNGPLLRLCNPTTRNTITRSGDQYRRPAMINTALSCTTVSNPDYGHDVDVDGPLEP